MQEKRKHKRIPLHYNLKVSDSESVEHLGYLIDVTEEGFKLISEDQISEGSVLQCTVHLPEDLGDWKELSFKAKACWSRQDVNPDYYVSGYHIDGMEPEGETIISLIIRHYGYNI